MRPHVLLFLLLTISSIFSGCATSKARNRTLEKNLPSIILWAWERPEDLSFLNSDRFGVAYLAQTLTLKNDEVLVQPRRQPLKVSATTRLIAVTRIESQKTTGQPVALSDKQRDRLTTLILRTLDQPQVIALQVDFDAVQSERKFYRGVLEALRQKVPDDVPVSITALASFCIGDRWFGDLPVDEAIPMIFRMGQDSEQIKEMLLRGNDFRDGLCRSSYGLAVDEPFAAELRRGRRLYFFNAHSWTPADIAVLEKRIGS